MSELWLSVDWDYFVRELPAWDFGHRESPFFRDGMWPIREAGFRAQGGDLRKEMDPEIYSEPAPNMFWKALMHMGYTFENARVVVSDSHMYAADVFIREREDMGLENVKRLVHFDAHHDLGYQPKLVRKHIAAQEADCADWHLMTLRHWTELQSLVVYPAWKGKVEWEGTLGKLSLKKTNKEFLRRVRATTWPCPRVERWSGAVETIFICRSGSWAPPWLDTAFIDLVNDLIPLTGREPETPFTEDEKCDPLQERTYDHQAMEDHANMIRELTANVIGT